MPLLKRLLVASCLLCLGWSAEAQAWNPLVLGGQCKQSGGRCSGTIGNRGQTSGACCDPGDRNVLTCVSQNPCIGGRSYKWSTQNFPLSWWFNANGMAGKNGFAGLSESQIEAALKKGWSAWNSPTCTSFTHNYRGKSTSLPSRRVDNKLVLYLANPQTWAQLGGGGSTLAFTMPVPNNNGQLLDADIVYNPSPGRGWGVGTKTDIVGVTAHEAGHAIGFAHAARNTSLMFYAHSGNFFSLPKDERDGVCFTYPGKCTKDADCGSCLQCTNGRCTRKTISFARNLCRPCTQPSDCGGAKDICIRLKEGQRCAQECASGCCPIGYRCTDVGVGQMMCIPDIGKCADVACTTDANCGPGEQCSGRTCRPKPVPKDPKSCKTCTTDANCGAKNKCFTFPDGKKRCAQACVVDNFCPANHICKSVTGGRFCFPEDFVCTCAGNSDCIVDEICQSGTCRPSSCKYGCSCNDKVKCDAPFTCFQTQTGGSCFQGCGGAGSTSFPKGVPGSACNNNKCSLGAKCLQLQGGGTVCLKSCTSNTTCASTGGKCYKFGTQNFCACTKDTECLSQQACNKSILSSSGGGACAPKAGSQPCETNFQCKDAGGVKICLPKPIRNVWESCGDKLACKEGLFCLRTTSALDSGVCFEDCSKTNKCTFGGACNLSLSNNMKACGCSAHSQCLNGKKCIKTLANGQLGYCGAPTFKCGDKTCELNKGEDCGNCPSDCACATGLVCDKGACKSAGPRCGDGKCDTGENCGSCAGDCKCPTGRVCSNNKCVLPAPTCGNQKCDAGENCSSCAADCPCPTGKSCNNSVCVAPPKDCGNNTCETAKGENCLTCASDCACPTSQVCSNGTCGVPPTSCGNGTCDANENCGTCIQDCACATGQTCLQNRCQTQTNSCGNGVCDANENCGTCAADCSCATGQVCQNGQCKSSVPKNPLPCPIEDQLTECDANGENCKPVCGSTGPKKGCGCVSVPERQVPTFLLFILGVWLVIRRKKGTTEV